MVLAQFMIKNGNIIATCPAYKAQNNYINLLGNDVYTPLPIPQNDDISNIYQALHYGIKKFLKKYSYAKSNHRYFWWY